MTTVGAASVGEVSQAGFFDAIKATISFYRCMLYFIRGSSYKACPFFADKLQVRARSRPVVVLSETLVLNLIQSFRFIC